MVRNFSFKFTVIFTEGKFRNELFIYGAIRSLARYFNILLVYSKNSSSIAQTS